MKSKKLLSEVLGIDTIDTAYISDNLIIYSVFGDNGIRRTKSINIHELAYKCKEFALSEGYWIDSNLNFAAIGKSGSAKRVKSFNGYDLKLDEPRLTIMSCEWILEKKTTS